MSLFVSFTPRSRRAKPDAAGQLRALEKFGECEPIEFLTLHAEAAFVIARVPASDEVQMRAAMLLSKMYPHIAPDNTEYARRVHSILLRELREPRATLAHPSCNWLLMTHLRDENLKHIPWENAAEVTSAAECFYGFCDGTVPSEEAHRRVRDLVKHAGYHFAKRGRWEEAFKLISTIPLPTSAIDADLFRLRNTLALYEQKRIARFRRSLKLFMIVALIFIVGIAPLAFWELECAARIEKGMTTLSYPDCLYWSAITSATVGYGEIVPITTGGRILAIIDSLFGVTFTGLIAGLILARITPRPLS